MTILWSNHSEASWLGRDAWRFMPHKVKLGRRSVNKAVKDRLK